MATLPEDELDMIAAACDGAHPRDIAPILRQLDDIEDRKRLLSKLPIPTKIAVAAHMAGREADGIDTRTAPAALPAAGGSDDGGIPASHIVEEMDRAGPADVPAGAHPAVTPEGARFGRRALGILSQSASKMRVPPSEAAKVGLDVEKAVGISLKLITGGPGTPLRDRLLADVARFMPELDEE